MRKEPYERKLYKYCLSRLLRIKTSYKFCACSMFYLPRKRFRLVLVSNVASISIVSRTNSYTKCYRNGRRWTHNRQKYTAHNYCVGLCRVPTTHRTYKNAIGHKSSAELLLNICVNVLFTRKNCALWRFIAQIFGRILSLSLSLQYTILVVSKWTNESNLSIANPIFTSSWFDSDKIKSVVHTVEYVVRSSLAPAK